VSGPARPRTAPPRAADPLVIRGLRVFRGLADSPFLDRLIRGRLWIPIVATALMGIVAMQVSMLKMNAGISRAVETASTLERQNAIYRADVSHLEAGSRVDQVAQRLGMVQPAEDSPHYVQAGRPGAAELAARRMTAPSSAATQTAQSAATGQVAPPASAQQQTQPQTTPPQAATQTPAPVQQQTATAPTQSATTATAPPATQQQTATPQQQAAPPAQSAGTATTAGAVAAPTAGQQ
jgi:hypothetical protein